ncbi:hypothetical protein F2Q69_00032163 [Brassica cretica]|uniref:DNA topoisomerase (ATP-hydrolyzing) n=1 Tax=Brassica cretica TaxID=69181 RepID=A0A8S9RZ56_BRACR|nr:hypothetical protein F2Q69_00032163 [Brassica cretica]
MKERTKRFSASIYFNRFVLQDDDGTHMSGLLINLFSFLWPSLLKLPSSFLIDFVTPLIKVTHETKEAETFSSLREFKEWKEKDKAHATE